MRLSDINKTKGVIFTHLDPETQHLYHIYVTGILTDPDYLALEVGYIPVDRSIAELLIHERGIEKHRLTRLMHRKIKEPLTLCIWDDGSHLIVDGNHRFVAATLSNRKHVPVRMVPGSIWKKYIVRDLLDVQKTNLPTKFSGIL